MVRRSTLECKLEKLFKDIGTIYFSDYGELGMMLDESDRHKVMRLIKLLDEQRKIYLDFENGVWILDYIGF